MSREITLEAFAGLNPELFDTEELTAYCREGMPHRTERGVVMLGSDAWKWIAERADKEITVGTQHTGSSAWSLIDGRPQLRMIR
jgi:hypothetical protein